MKTAPILFIAICSPFAQAIPIETIDRRVVIRDISDAWVRLFVDKAYRDRCLTITGGQSPTNLKKVRSDNGEKGFNDKASSVRFQIPKGWKLVLFDDRNHKDSPFELKGTGKVVEIPDLGSFSDKTSSARWERDPS